MLVAKNLTDGPFYNNKKLVIQLSIDSTNPLRLTGTQADRIWLPYLSINPTCTQYFLAMNLDNVFKRHDHTPTAFKCELKKNQI